MQVRLGKPRAQGATAAGEELISAGRGGPTRAERDEISVTAEVEPWPDRDWFALWREADFPNDLEEPRFQGGYIGLTVADADLRRAWAAVKQRVEATNHAYGETVIPRRQAEEHRRQEEEAARERRFEEAQRLVDKLE